MELLQARGVGKTICPSEVKELPKISSSDLLSRKNELC